MKYFKKVIVAAVLAMLVVITTLSAFANGTEEFNSKEFDGKTVAIQTGTIYSNMVGEVFPNSKVLYYANVPDCITALRSGKVEFVYSDAPVVRYAKSGMDEIKQIDFGEGDNMAILSSKTEKGQKLIDEFNSFFKKFTESGEKDKLISKWFDGKEEDRKPIDYSSLTGENGTLVGATDPAFPPFEYTKDNVVVGYEPEVMYLFCKEYGYGLDIKTVGFDGIIAGVTSGKFDIGMSGFSVTEERKKQVLFSDVIYVSRSCVAYVDGASNSGLLNNITERFKTTFFEEKRYEMFVSGVIVTLEIVVLSILFGLILGFILHLLCRRKNKVANIIVGFFRWLIHGMPVVVFLMILFYIIFGKSNIDGKWIAVFGFTLIFGFSVLGMLQTAENAIDQGQYDASTALGYSNLKAFFKIILPQMIKHFMPSLQAEIVSHIKATSIVGYIAVVDVTKVGDIIRGTTYDAFVPLIAVAIMYFVISWIFRMIFSFINKKIEPTNRSTKSIFKGVEIR